VRLVLDASYALAWIFARADAGEARQADAALGGLNSLEALVPTLWHVEVVNALVVALRRGVVSVSRATDFLARLDRLPIHTDDAPVSPRKEHVFALAREYDLSAYDATYLDLALRTGAALATFDKSLAHARDRSGVAAF
jgi:predicted nucleic acid-binding protein